MKSRFKKILALFILIVTIAGWYVTVFGIGNIHSIKDVMKFGLDINGGVYVVMEADTKATGQELSKLMDQTRQVLNNRVNAMGISEATVSQEGSKRLRVEMPGVKDADEAINQIGRTAQLKFTLADGSTVLTGSDVKNAQIDTDSQNGGYKIVLEFTGEGQRKFSEATAKAVSGTITSNIQNVQNNAIVIWLDNEIVTAPSVRETITSNTCEITSGQGGYGKEEASRTAALIRGGALPLTLHEVETSVQTASIGVNALEKSVVAGIIGVGLILLLMVLMYNILGLLADLALLLYILIVLWIMAGMGSVLTLAGIAGIILSIGMAVDANVIIFARIREEISAGKSIRVAVAQGFKNALTTVLDAQITTLIASLVLYQIGTTQVKGFAITLMIGIVVSIFTAVIVTQLYVGLIASSRPFAKNKYFGCKEDGTPKHILKKQFDFIGKRKVFYAISCVVIVCGIIAVGFRGFNAGIDFTGGTMMQYDLGKKVSSEEVEKAIEKFDLSPTIIYSGANQEQVVIKTIKALDTEKRAEVTNTMKESFGISDKDVISSEQFGPTIGKELKTNAVKSILIAAFCMLLYIIFRFKSWKYGVASISGILHDVLVVLSFYAIFAVTINNPFIAGILTVVGYSINDTIVIFDRIRENKRLDTKGNNKDILNRSINQTLNRSLMTSITTLICMVPLFVMVSSSIREFVLPLMFGVVVGTYSSIFLCTPLLYEFFKKEDVSKYQARQKALKLEKGKQERHEKAKAEKKESDKAHKAAKHKAQNSPHKKSQKHKEKKH